MADYFATQLTGSRCQGRNCAAASGAMVTMFGRGAAGISADEFRERSGSSCVPGAHSPSGGLYISDVERTAKSYGVTVDYGREPGTSTAPKRWSWNDGLAKLQAGLVAVFLGDYDQMGAYAASSFRGDHSAVAHLRPGQPAGTCCWHDPLRKAPIDLPLTVLKRYWQKPLSPVRGYAGWVRPKVVAAPTWTAAIRPSSPGSKVTFHVYEVAGSRVTDVSTSRTGGFSATCTAPKRYTRTGQPPIDLVRLTSGSRKGLYISAQHARKS